MLERRSPGPLRAPPIPLHTLSAITHWVPSPPSLAGGRDQWAGGGGVPLSQQHFLLPFSEKCLEGVEWGWLTTSQRRPSLSQWVTHPLTSQPGELRESLWRLLPRYDLVREGLLSKGAAIWRPELSGPVTNRYRSDNDSF